MVYLAIEVETNAELRSERLDVGPYHWEYLVGGVGPEPLIAFHGFGQSAADFKDFVAVLGDRYTLVCMNLYGHGDSCCDLPSEAAAFNEKELSTMFHTLLEKHGWERVSILGYSLGGRICLCLLEEMPERIHRALLLAPDGLTKNLWYRFVTSHWIGQRIFKRAVENPRPLKLAGRLLAATGLVRKKLITFAWENFDNASKRQRVYDVWMFYRHILPTLKDVIRGVKTHGVSVVFFLGRYDKILPPSDVDRWVNALGHLGSKQQLDAGHQLLTRSVAEAVRKFSGSIE
ncbi:MAG: alpha/beta hydrolase [Bacteroidota bacterium]